MFQSTRPRGARHHADMGQPRGPRFNPRARVGRDRRWIDDLFRAHQVSIHAPAWGATVYRRAPPDVRGNVSIHAPAWGATTMIVPIRIRRRCFNPRARVGRDPDCPATSSQIVCFNPRARVGRDPCRHPICRRLQVSIHAPAWGATTVRRNTRCSPSSFNPRARVGRDAKAKVEKATKKAFQSTRPRGARPRKFYGVPGGESVSIHAPAWGATFTQYEKMLMKPLVSIHAPAWGATAIRI